MRSFMKYIIPMVLILAVIGLGFELLTDPLGFVSSILISIGFIAVIYFVFKWVMAKRHGTSLFSSPPGPTRAQLQKAKRTSTKQRPAPSPLNRGKEIRASKAKYARSAINRKEGHHLTVIEGKKNKKKNRAFF
ncbi:SoxR reducing system RseC family protein [bacterium LRH843]|nr:SoxR reducing system RseC family protein [bacterium LRH843]